MDSRFAPLLVAAVLGAPAVGSAQGTGFALERFQLAPTPEDGLSLQLPSTLGPSRWSVRFALGYEREPLVSGLPTGGEVAIVRDVFGAQGALALGLGDRIELSLLWPVTLDQSGEEQTGSGLQILEPEGAGLGDVALGGSALLLDDPKRRLQLGLNAAVLLPTGSTEALASDGEVGARLSFTGALALEGATLALEVGAAYRPERVFGFLDSGSELRMRAGAVLPLGPDARLLAELNGATRLAASQAFEKRATPLELLLGGDYALPSGLRLGLGAGVGLTLATGTPLVRILATIAHAGPREPAAESAAPPAP